MIVFVLAFAIFVVAVLGIAALAVLGMVIADAITAARPAADGDDDGIDETFVQYLRGRIRACGAHVEDVVDVASPGAQMWARSTETDTAAMPILTPTDILHADGRPVR